MEKYRIIGISKATEEEKKYKTLSKEYYYIETSCKIVDEINHLVGHFKIDSGMVIHEYKDKNGNLISEVSHTISHNFSASMKASIVEGYNSIRERSKTLCAYSFLRDCFIVSDFDNLDSIKSDITTFGFEDGFILEDGEVTHVLVNKVLNKV